MFETMNMSIPSLKEEVSHISQSYADRCAAPTNLPSPSSVRRPAGIIRIFLVLQYVRLSLQCEAQGLDRSGDESNKDTGLKETHDQ